MYTNELPEIVNKLDCDNEVHDNRRHARQYLFGETCPECGQMMQYADDATYVTASKSRETNQRNIEENMDKIKSFLNANELCINETKTTLIELMNKQKRARIKGNPLELTVMDSEGQPKVLAARKDCRLLGANLAQDLTWTAHLVTGEKPLLPELRRQVGAVRYISREIPKRSRKVLAEGLVIARIQYLLPMWGGAPHKYIRKIQAVLNNVARTCTNRGRRAHTKELMEEMNWLTVEEMTTQQTMVILWKILRRRQPRYFTNILTLNENNFLDITPARLQLTSHSFRWRAAIGWNSLNEEMRSCLSLQSFKKQLKIWLIGQRTGGVREEEEDSVQEQEE